MTDVFAWAIFLASAGLLVTEPTAAQTPSPASRPWDFYASASAYVIEDDDDYLQPTLIADRDRLHLEARFNYEDRDTGSAWVGYNASFGEDIAFEITPMLGVVFGNTDGVAPGFKGTLGWRNLSLYSETEYVFDADESRDSYLYTWTELTVSPTGRWRAGLVAQRTKTYETELDIQRGILLGVSFERLELTGYVLNPDESPTVVVAIGAGL